RSSLDLNQALQHVELAVLSQDPDHIHPDLSRLRMSRHDGTTEALDQRCQRAWGPGIGGVERGWNAAWARGAGKRGLRVRNIELISLQSQISIVHWERRINVAVNIRLDRSQSRGRSDSRA